MKNIPKCVIDEANELGCEKVKLLGKWKGGTTAYEPYNEPMTCLGLPVYILEKDGKARSTEDDEWREIMRWFYPDDE